MSPPTRERMERLIALAGWMTAQAGRDAEALGIAVPEANQHFSGTLAIEGAADLLWAAVDDAAEFPDDGQDGALELLDASIEALLEVVPSHASCCGPSPDGRL